MNNINDFLPIYNSISLDNYFSQSIFLKEEFNNLKSSVGFSEKSDNSNLLKHQEIISRYLSPFTPYNSLLVFHYMGTGKTCVALGAIENFRRWKNKINDNYCPIGMDWLKNKIAGAIVLSPPRKILLNNLMNELINKCSDKKDLKQDLSETTEITQRLKTFIKHNYDNFYTFETSSSFVNKINYFTQNILDFYSNKIFVIDEVHKLRIEDSSKISLLKNYLNVENNLDNINRIFRHIRYANLLQSINTFIHKEEINIFRTYKQNDEIIRKLQELYDSQKLKTNIHNDFFETFPINIFRNDLKINLDIESYNLNSRNIDKVLENAGKNLLSIRKYTILFNLFHNITNSKVIILSGTPMVNGSHEIALIMNLILPKNLLLPIGKTDFESLSKEQLDFVFKGRTSYIAPMENENIIIKYKGTPLEETNNNIIANLLPFKDYQNDIYLKIFDDTKDDTLKNSSQEAALFVYPNGTFGREGYTNYINEEEKKSQLSIIRKNISGKTNYIFSLKNKKQFLADLTINITDDYQTKIEKIKNYSIKFATVIENILNNPTKNTFVFTSIVRGSGAIILSLILEEVFGFKRGNDTVSTKTKRYILLTSLDENNISKYVERFNKPDNKNGDYIQVIIGSDIVSEGITFKNIQQIHILTPFWNFSTMDQAIARGIREFSHDDLDLEESNY